MGIDQDSSIITNNCKNKKFIGHHFRNQNYCIGLNIIPTGNLFKFSNKYNSFFRLFKNSHFDLMVFPDLLCGHTSVISINKYGKLNKKYSRGYAPGFLDSLIIFLASLFGFFINVPGKLSSENDSIIGDPLSIQILIKVHYKTYKMWNESMDKKGIQGDFSFNPTSAFNEGFKNHEGKNSNNCTTLALNKVLNICSDLLENEIINKNDKYNLNSLKLSLSLIIDQLVKENNKKGNSIGCQGRFYREVFE